MICINDIIKSWRYLCGRRVFATGKVHWLSFNPKLSFRFVICRSFIGLLKHLLIQRTSCERCSQVVNYNGVMALHCMASNCIGQWILKKITQNFLLLNFPNNNHHSFIGNFEALNLSMTLNDIVLIENRYFGYIQKTICLSSTLCKMSKATFLICEQPVLRWSIIDGAIKLSIDLTRLDYYNNPMTN